MNTKNVKFGVSLSVLLSLSIAGIAFAVGDSFERDLYFGLRGDPEVIKLQEFLTKEMVYSGPQNGNFFALTKEAVVKYQTANNIVPASGYFGPMTRALINGKLAGSVQITDKAAQIQALQAQIDALLKQLAMLQSAGAVSIPTPAPEPATTTPVVSEVVVPVQVATTTTTVSEPSTVTLPNPFNSTLRIEGTYPGLTFSSYGDKILQEFKVLADEKIAITRLRFKNNGTWVNAIIGLELVDSQSGAVLASVEELTDNIADFKITPNSNKPDNGLVVSGKTYYIHGFLITPVYGATKPYIQLDLEKSSDISAFDYNDLTRVALVPQVRFPVEGPRLTAY